LPGWFLALALLLLLMALRLVCRSSWRNDRQQQAKQRRKQTPGTACLPQLALRAASIGHLAIVARSARTVDAAGDSDKAVVHDPLSRFGPDSRTLETSLGALR
jgi:hypothetical protein